MIKPQKQFPYYEEFKKKFPITDETIFIFNGVIFSNNELPPDIMVHEEVHLLRQHQIGAKKWIRKYLNNTKFRLKEELLAYRKQIAFIDDNEAKTHCRIECATNLSSSLYGNLLTYPQALKLLR